MRKFIYLFFALTLGFLVRISLSNPEMPAVQPLAQTLYKPKEITSDLLTLTNQQRVGLFPYTETTELDSAAAQKCQDMETRNYWDHSINGEDFYKFMPIAQKYGENLARGFSTDEQVINGWMNSPEHKVNMLDNFTQVGFAKCEGPIHELVVMEIELPL